jgi:hypothetical protein
MILIVNSSGFNHIKEETGLYIEEKWIREKKGVYQTAYCCG